MSNLEQECGVTDISLRNGEKLVKTHGCPVKVIGKNEGGEYIVTARWHNVSFDFTGFSWGYNGTGPNGLVKFLNQCGFDISIAEIASMNQKLGFEID